MPESQEGVSEKIFKEMLIKLFLSFMKTKLTDPASSTSPGDVNNHIKAHNSQTAKNVVKRLLKATRE